MSLSETPSDPKSGTIFCWFHVAVAQKTGIPNWLAKRSVSGNLHSKPGLPLLFRFILRSQVKLRNPRAKLPRPEAPQFPQARGLRTRELGSISSRTGPYPRRVTNFQWVKCGNDPHPEKDPGEKNKKKKKNEEPEGWAPPSCGCLVALRASFGKGLKLHFTTRPCPCSRMLNPLLLQKSTLGSSNRACDWMVSTGMMRACLTCMILYQKRSWMEPSFPN